MRETDITKPHLVGVPAALLARRLHIDTHPVCSYSRTQLSASSIPALVTLRS
jgi:hypothetical protein